MGVQMVIATLAQLALLSLVNGFGSDGTAAYGVVNQLVNYVQLPALSIGIATSILGAQAIGGPASSSAADQGCQHCRNQETHVTVRRAR